MKFSICNELYFDRTFEAACDHARKLGYQGIELAPYTLAANVFEISASARAEIVATAARCDLEIVGLHWLLAKTTGLHLTVADRQVRERTKQYLGALIELCSDLGGRTMVLGSPQQRSLRPETTYAEGFERACEILQALAPQLESRNVVLALEPLGPEETNFLTTAASTIELIEAVGSSHVGLTLDVKAMSTELEEMPVIIQASRRHLAHFHANDPNRQGPGMGAVSFPPILQSLERIDYRGWVSVEVFDYSPGIEALAEQSIQTLTTCRSQ